jgi:uncharacterized protein DUF3237
MPDSHPSGKPEHVPSPGNSFLPAELAIPPMRRPHLEFVYRIVANMDPNISRIDNIDGTGLTRLILPIKDGLVEGPQIKGVIVENSGADWAEVPDPDKVRSPVGSLISSNTLTQTGVHEIACTIFDTYR